MCNYLNDDFLISPDFKVSDWLNARDDVDLPKMIAIFKNRIEGRFLNPIRIILADDSKIAQFSGFSIMALDCLLIETLKQFYDGVDETSHDHEKQFKDFFKDSYNFKSLGTTKKARIFYSHFRCGLLHQAQTKRKSKIKTNLGKLFIPENNLDDGMTIDRNLFHQYLEDEIRRYMTRLLDDNSTILRVNFIKKMNYICNLMMV